MRFIGAGSQFDYLIRAPRAGRYRRRVSLSVDKPGAALGVTLNNAAIGTPTAPSTGHSDIGGVIVRPPVWVQRGHEAAPRRATYEGDMHMTRAPRSRWIAVSLAFSLALPAVAMTAGCGNKGNNAQQTDNSAPIGPMADTNAAPAKPGLSGKQKLVLLAGAALLFYIYKKDKANNAAAANGAPGGKPQLYQEEKGPNKGAIYYRDANHQVHWLKAPAQGVQVPADQVQQYLPDYNAGNPNAYAGPVNTNPQNGVNGGTVESADQYAGAAQ